MVNAQAKAKARGENNVIQPCSPEGKPEKDRRLLEGIRKLDTLHKSPSRRRNIAESQSDVLKHVQRYWRPWSMHKRTPKVKTTPYSQEPLSSFKTDRRLWPIQLRATLKYWRPRPEILKTMVNATRGSQRLKHVNSFISLQLGWGRQFDTSANK